MNDSAASVTAKHQPPKASPDRAIFSLLSAAHALEDMVDAALGQAGLSSPKFAVLSALVASPDPLSLSELANRLSCVRSNITQLVDRLEADGLVQRVSCPSDRRSVKAEITYRGRERQRAAAAEMERLQERFAERVNDEDRAALARLLTALA
jgi:DNA-binding MarR family transcriptional regulator